MAQGSAISPIRRPNDHPTVLPEQATIYFPCKISRQPVKQVQVIET